MDRLRLILANIQKQLTKLTVTQKLLVASLCVVLLMTLFLVSQYTGTPTMVALLPGGTGEDQQKAVGFLQQHGFNYKVGTDGKVMLMPDQRYLALGAMAKEQALPGDKKLLFDGLTASSGSNWLEPLADKQMKQNIALQNELARVIRTFPGLDDASVFISHPVDNGGIGAAAKKSVAQVAVFPVSGQGLDQPTVNALVDLVAGSVSGLDPHEVAVIDGRNRRSYRAVSAEELGGGGGTYIEQVARVEKRVQEKISEHLKFIPDVIVSVNAIVDAAKRESVTTKVLGKGEGTVSVPVEETTSTETSQNTTKGGGEAGLQPNIGMSVNNSSTSGTSTSHETSTVKNEVKFGESKMTQRDASGRPTKINVTVSVPREYVAAIVKQKKSGAAGGGGAGGGGGAAATEPSDADISTEFESVKPRIEEMISPLVETDGAGGAAPGASGTGGAAAQLVAGTVKAFLIPVSMVSSGGGGGGSGRTGVMGGSGGLGSLTGITTLMESGLVKTVALGVLAVVALGMMLSMVRKAGKAPTMPTAEELVGIPPALEPGTDVVGEAVEGDTAMQGIEVDDESLKTGKMIEEIGDLVKSNPSNAANVFSKWLNDHE